MKQYLSGLFIVALAFGCRTLSSANNSNSGTLAASGHGATQNGDAVADAVYSTLRTLEMSRNARVQRQDFGGGDHSLSLVVSDGSTISCEHIVSATTGVIGPNTCKLTGANGRLSNWSGFALLGRNDDAFLRQLFAHMSLFGGRPEGQWLVVRNAWTATFTTPDWVRTNAVFCTNNANGTINCFFR
jgi:hypothetical protein